MLVAVIIGSLNIDFSFGRISVVFQPNLVPGPFPTAPAQNYLGRSILKSLRADVLSHGAGTNGAYSRRLPGWGLADWGSAMWLRINHLGGLGGPWGLLRAPRTSEITNQIFKAYWSS